MNCKEFGLLKFRQSFRKKEIAEAQNRKRISLPGDICAKTENAYHKNRKVKAK
jgi:hypothetical protein